MTKSEELLYLSDLLLQASRWERSEGETLSGLELEVQDRMRRLTGVNTIDADGRAQSEPNFTPTDPNYGYKKQWCKDKVRIKLDNGKIRWVLKEHCHKVPRPTQPYLSKWQVKEEFKHLY